VPSFRVDQFDRDGPLLNFKKKKKKNNFLDARTSMYMAIQKRFAEEGIELSYQKINVTVNNGELPEIYAHFTNKGDL
jgi:small-conductance mechanosensitive channel